jgi:hypothetical protein
MYPGLRVIRATVTLAGLRRPHCGGAGILCRATHPKRAWPGLRAPAPLEASH